MSHERSSFALFSINHENASLEARERFAVDDGRLDALYRHLGECDAIDESLALSTCNRFELYAQLSGEAEAVVALLADFFGRDAGDFARLLEIHSGSEAVRHLIEVASGLRSQITGEAEIFGQVKDAYAVARDRGAAGKAINRIFQKGFQAAKLIRNATSIGSGQISVANVAVDLSLKIFGSLGEASVLSIGTGDIGEKTVKALRSRGVESFGVASRTVARAEEVARAWGGRPHALVDLDAYLPHYDIAISSVGAEQAVITRDLAKAALHKRKGRPLFVIDLGLPRNVEPSCGDLDNLFLYNLDDLGAIAEQNLQERRKAAAECAEMAGHRARAIWESVAKRGFAR